MCLAYYIPFYDSFTAKANVSKVIWSTDTHIAGHASELGTSSVAQPLPYLGNIFDIHIWTKPLIINSSIIQTLQSYLM